MKQFLVSYAIKTPEIFLGFGTSVVTNNGKLSFKDTEKIREDINKELDSEIVILAISELADEEE